MAENGQTLKFFPLLRENEIVQVWIATKEHV